MSYAPLPFPSSRKAVWKRVPPYALLACVLVLAVAPRFIFSKHSEWQQVYADTGRQFRDGDGLYGKGQPYVYPPFMAAVAMPFASLPEKGSRAVWLLINALALVVVVRSAWQLAGGGRRLPGWDSSRSEHLIVWLGLACGGYYILDALGHQQTDLVIAALLLRGCLALQQDRSLLAGVLFGIAAGCKCTPLLFAPYLIWRGRWVGSIALVATAIVINFIPDLIHRPAQGGTWLNVWFQTYIAPQVRGEALPGMWASDVIYNQSLAGALNRWTQTNWEWTAAGVTVVPAVDALSAVQLKQLVRIAQFGLIAMAALVFLHRPFRKTAGDSAGPRDSLECSLILILMLLLSPMSSKPHFCTLMLAGFCLGRAIMQTERRVLIGSILGLAIVCGLLANKDLVRARIYTLVLWYGLVTISALTLGLGCGYCLLRNRKQEVIATGMDAGKAKRIAA